MIPLAGIRRRALTSTVALPAFSAASASASESSTNTLLLIETLLYCKYQQYSAEAFRAYRRNDWFLYWTNGEVLSTQVDRYTCLLMYLSTFYRSLPGSRPTSLYPISRQPHPLIHS